MSEEFVIKSEKPFTDISVPKSMSEILWNKLEMIDENSVCIIEANSDTKLTVKELITKSNALAMALLEKGINKSDIILTFADNSIELVIAIFASIWLGTTVCPISPIANIYEMEGHLETLESMVIFTSTIKAEIISKALKNSKINDSLKLITILDGTYDDYIDFSELLEQGSDQRLPTIPFFNVDPVKDIFIMLQSSGTTGVPKSVLHTHYGYSLLMTGLTFWTPGERPVFGNITPFGSISGSGFLFRLLTSGVVVVIYSAFNEQLIVESIEKYKITFMFITPPLGHRLIDGQLVDNYDLSSLQFVTVGGSAFSATVAETLVRKFNLKFTQGYGMTEFGAITDFLGSDTDELIEGNLGPPNVNTELKVIDLTNGSNLGPDIDGEICVRGPSMFAGYLNNSLATNEAIDSEGWLHTGDIGHYDQQNRFFITDRLKELIKYGTKQVSPTEIELFLETHKCVAEAAVVGVKHEIESQWVRAYVKVKDGMSVTEEEIKQYVSDNMNDAKQLRAGVVFVDHIPRTSLGKVNRRYFKQLVANELIASV